MKPPEAIPRAPLPRDGAAGPLALRHHDVNGTTPAWRKARTAALNRAGHRCDECDRTEGQAKCDGTWLKVHHIDGGGGRADRHHVDKLLVMCRTPCHTRTFAGR